MFLEGHFAADLVPSKYILKNHIQGFRNEFAGGCFMNVPCILPAKKCPPPAKADCVSASGKTRPFAPTARVDSYLMLTWFPPFAHLTPFFYLILTFPPYSDLFPHHLLTFLSAYSHLLSWFSPYVQLILTSPHSHLMFTLFSHCSHPFWPYSDLVLRK